MPHFYFNLFNGIDVIDEKGSDLPDVGAARITAVRRLREFACDQIFRGHLIFASRVEITDEAGQVLEFIPLRDTVDFQ
jgi:hypothetical protein